MTDADQFEAFVRSHQKLVFGTAVRLLGNPQDAEDVSQAVFLRAFERFRSIGECPGAAAWLRTVTRNLCLNHLTRHRSRWRLFSELAPGGEDAASGAFESTLVAPPSTMPELDDVRRQERLEDAVRRLPAHQRVPLVLFHFEGQKYREIAHALKVSLGKVKTDIHRGREALKRVLADDHEPV